MNDRGIVDEFVIESREHLADIENQLLAIESEGADADPELVNTVFRAIHSIKGSAGFLGFSTVGQLAHDLENVLNLVRSGQLIPDGAVTNVLLRSADQLRTMIDDVHHSNTVDVSELVGALQAIVTGLLAEGIPPTVSRETGDLPDPSPTPAGQPLDTLEGDTATDVDRATVSPSATSPSEPLDTFDPLSPPAAAAASLPRDSDTAGSSAGPAGTPADSNIRVAVTVLDRLMNLAGELVLSRNQLLQTVGSSDLTALGPVAARVNQITSELQETIMQTRLQAIGTVFGRFPRVVRDLSSTLGKQCQLTIEGKEVELDKSIIEAIGDPLTHLIRNAVDHGIERPEVRLRAGKPAAGSIALRAFHQSGKVHVQITDDGRGIDAARLREKAVAKGLITPEQAAAMSERETLLLIFRPGFSMAEQVTGVSGRGVGMDVVKTNIERLGGTVSVDTQLGKGTTIHVKLPLTLAIIPSLVVRCDGRPYAIPQASIRELVRVKASDVARRVERVQDAEVFRLRGALLPLVRLRSVLAQKGSGTFFRGAPSSTEDPPEKSPDPFSAVHIIVVETGHLRYGLVVDGLNDSEEIVVKPLGRHMKGCTCLAGATILGDGNVALILDIAGIAAHGHLTIAEEEATSDAFANNAPEETQAVLLFTNAPDEHFGIAMDVVARLERVRTDQIDSVGGRQVLQYRGGTLPLLSLEHCIECQARSTSDRVYVVVFAAAGREVGLIVPELTDIRSVPLSVDTVTFREPGIAGSFVYDRMTVRLVDLHELTRHKHPEWYVVQPATQRAEGVPARVLVVEDSDFFRKQLIGFMEAEGYEVRGCEDGTVAWSALGEPDQEYDLVVTDIEMPHMDGLQLARHIRNDRRFDALPIIAVTSLAGEDDIRRGREVGINEYHIKLDREVLLAAVGRLIKASLSSTISRSRS